MAGNNHATIKSSPDPLQTRRDVIGNAAGLVGGDHDRPRLEGLERVEAGEVDPGTERQRVCNGWPAASVAAGTRSQR